MIKKLMMMFAVALAVFYSRAATETVDGIEWTYTVWDGEASVGSNSSPFSAVPKTTSGVITNSWRLSCYEHRGSCV